MVGGEEPQEEDRSHLAWIIAAGGVCQPGRHADSLLAEFGSLGSVLAGPSNRQLKATAYDAGAVRQIARFRSAMLHVLRSRLADRPVLPDSQSLRQYLRADMAFGQTERFRVLCLNVKNRLLRDEVIAQGTADRVGINVREVLGRAIEVGAASLIIVHNHPSGDVRPSRADIDLTKRLARLAGELDMVLLDHLIVGGADVFSFRDAGLLR